jgi:8-oxo-dGTP pyrophosphatase MutT (NUDIX family)
MNIIEKYRSASIVPVHKGTRDDRNCYILLGRKALHYVEKWGDLGGQLKPGENWEEAAAREFLEETLLCVDINCDTNINNDDCNIYYRDRYDDLVKRLKNEDYVCKVRFCDETKESVHYFMLFEMDTKSCERFAMIRRLLLTTSSDPDVPLHNMIRNHPAINHITKQLNSSFLEQRNIEWISIDMIKCMLRQHLIKDVFNIVLKNVLARVSVQIFSDPART